MSTTTCRDEQAEHVEDTVLACQELVDANKRDEAIDLLMTIYVGGAMRRRLEQAGVPTVEVVEEKYREELQQIVSYLGHFDQDANHAWMVRRIRAVLAGKDPNTVKGWTEHDGVPAPKKAVPVKVVGTGYEPPKELWFHFHPAPHMVMPDGSERLAVSGDLWHDPFETKEAAHARLGESAGEGWIVVGPYTYEGVAAK